MILPTAWILLRYFLCPWNPAIYKAVSHLVSFNLFYLNINEPLWWWGTHFPSFWEHFLLLFFLFFFIFSYVSFGISISHILEVVHKLVCTLNLPVDLLKFSKLRSHSAWLSHIAVGGRQASGVFKPHRWFQCADDVGNHRCVRFLGFIFHVFLFSSLFSGVHTHTCSIRLQRCSKNSVILKKSN